MLGGRCQTDRQSFDKHKKILVVEDDRDLRETLCEICDMAGYESYGAQNGIEALEIYASTPFNLILTDCDMPEMNGLELIAQLRDRKNEVPVVLCSGRNLTDTEWQSRGFTAYLHKPSTPDDIFQVIEKYIL